MAAPPSRLYELRVASLADTRVRNAIAAVLARWVPVREDPRPGPTLDTTATVVRLALGDADAATLLRDLYATGVPPASVVLRPVDTGTPRERADASAVYEIFSDHGGRFVPTWNWRAFVFGPLWYLRRGLYAKGLILFGLSVCPFFTLAVTVLLSGTILVYCGVAGNWDDYLLKVKGTQWW